MVAAVKAALERSVTVDEATSANAAEWNAYVQRHPHGTVDHLWEWRHIFADVFRHRSVYLLARRDGQIAGILPLVVFNSRIFGRQLVSLPMLNHGGLLAEKDVADVLVDRATEIGRSAGARHIELRHASRWTDLPYRQHKVSMRLVLPDQPERLWSLLDRKVRNQVRKAQKSGLIAQSGGEALVPRFYAVFAENMRDLGTPVYPPELFTAVLERFGPHARVHLITLGDGEPVAGAIALSWNGTVLVPWASALKSHRHLCPNMLLYWTMLEQSIAEGAHTFDFGRSSPGGGTHQFKTQWGAHAEPQYWEYVLLRAGKVPDQGPSDGRFNLAIEAWKRLPLWLANSAGPHIVRNIP